jgi:3D (Asp-Asp-Asp) domain-containing protein
MIVFLFIITEAVDIRLSETNAKIQAVYDSLPAERQRTNRTLKPIEVTVTAYSPREEETDSTPYETAFLMEVKPGTIAVSRDLFFEGWIPGKRVYIYQIGVFEISDLMAAEKSNHLDVFFYSTEQAREFGVKKSKAILLEVY